MADVSLRNIHKSFGQNEVIHGISCDIHDGEFIVILGPSGCGKSTVLRMIAGLEVITKGELTIDDKVVNQLEPADRDIAMVFQNYALYPHMTVFKNMAYGLKIRRMPKAEIEKRVQKAAGILELTEFLNRKPRQLSGGQRQRVAMGRCIVREPKVFLFDEPLSNLDAKLRVQMRQELRNLHETLGITSVYVTHDQVEAMTLGDRLIVMENGYVEQIGSPLDVYEKPATHFVAGFIGSPAMNFFEARTSRDGQSAQLSDTETLPIHPQLNPSFRDQAIVLGIRPEHFKLAAERDGTMQMRVENLETLGADTLVHGKSAGNKTIFTVRLPDIHRYPKGSTLFLSISPEKLHLFDKESGIRIGA